MEELKFIEDIRCEYSLMNYVQILSKLKDNCLIILVVKDTAGNCLTSEEVDAIKTLGFTNLNTKPQNMYCGVLYGGKVLCNECGKERWQPVDVTLSGQIYNYEIELSSMAWQHGNKAEVIINGTDYAVNIRGLNFVVYDTEKKALIDSVAFDYHTENRQCKHKQFNNDISGGNHKVTIRNSLIK
ncbi:MAG: hypothetical protein LUD27_06895, partial [Clostridia bacterium]|nr:hypothetical protein [Clostridia bacterium]